MACKKCVIMVITAVILCMVKLRVVESQGVMLKKLPASKLQLEDLVPLVCDTLFAFQPDEVSKIANCTEDFPNFIGVSSSPSELRIVCQSDDGVTFSMPASKSKQLVLLIPNNNVYGIINYAILNAGEELGIISTDVPNSSFWTTELRKDGTPSMWKRGPHVPQWVPTKENNRTVVFSHKFDYRKVGLHKTDAVISWKIDADFCSDMTVQNVCFKNDGGDLFEGRITASTRSVIVSNVPLNDTCKFTLKQDGFQWSHVYKTQSCEELEGCIPLPDIPQDIYIEASEAGEDESREVYVSWARPRRAPDVYNVTLRADDVRSVIVSGNATELTFTDIIGEGYYNVSIQAITASGKALTSRRAVFPERTESPSPVLTLVAGACVVAGLVATAVWWRRRRAYKLAHLYFEGLEDKLPKECNLETGQESGVEDSWEVRPERLLLHEVIGEGAFGVVRKGTLAPGGKEVAVKMLKDFPSLDEIRSFRAEMELMKSVGAHPHVVSLVGCCSGRRPLIIAEYCNRGDLLSYLRCCWDIIVSKRNAKYYNNNIETADYRNDLPKPQKEQSKLVVNKLYDLHGSCDTELTLLDLLSFCRQIAMGMEFLSLNRVVHRDLAARNILISGDRTLKIADFGLSRDVYQENQYKQKGNGKMPVKWMALESLTHRIYTTQSDVWSFGVVVWEVVTVGGAPYPEVPAARLLRLLRAGYRMPRPNNCSKQLYDIMQSCWRARPRDRPTFAELHQQLDELLNSACADEYLSLELEGDDAPPTPRPQRYVKMILRSSRLWSKTESYERPLKGPQSNHYTSPPAPITRVQAV